MSTHALMPHLLYNNFMMSVYCFNVNHAGILHFISSVVEPHFYYSALAEVSVNTCIVDKSLVYMHQGGQITLDAILIASSGMCTTFGVVDRMLWRMTRRNRLLAVLDR